MESYRGRQALGQRGEREAEQFLISQGYQLIEKNYRSPYGEVDLIVLDHQAIVFVEVRTQSRETFGDPLESVNRRKQRQIARTALYYLTIHHLQHREARFDVIGIQWGKQAETKLTYIKHAFDLPQSWR